MHSRDMRLGSKAGRTNAAPIATVESIMERYPGGGEALVRIETCGLCTPTGTPCESRLNDEFPFLLCRQEASCRADARPTFGSRADRPGS